MQQKTVAWREKKRRQRELFRGYRRDGLRIAVPMYLLFSVIDWQLYPEYFLRWLSFRMFFCFVFISTFLLLKKKSFREKYSDISVLINLVLASTLVNLMIAQSGGHNSPYVEGLVLCTLIGFNILKMPIHYAIAANFLCYAPTVAIIAFSSDFDFSYLLLYTGYFLSFALLSFVFTSNSSKIDLIQNTKAEIFRDQIRKYQKSEVLKRQFPKYLRTLIEANEEFPRRKYIENAVVGFADMTNSCSFANQISLIKDWELKEEFMEMATKIATSYNFVVLTNMGDGFLFLANYEDSKEWSSNLVGFFQTLQNKFEQIKIVTLAGIDSEKLSIKCSASMGPTMVGFQGDEQTYYTAIGPEVNLAARLCDKALAGEMIVTNRVWTLIKNSNKQISHETMVLKDIKGFDNAIEVVKLKPDTIKSEERCAICDAYLSLFQNEDGHYDLLCTQDHNRFQKRIKI